jgi:hypothetical protein
MPSITTWSRLEPRARSESFNSLQARVHDPLWLLTRQWQLGEFKGEDAGTPIFSELSMHTTRVNANPGGIFQCKPNSIDATPLETVIEREPAALTIRDRIEAALCFMRIVFPVVKDIPDAHCQLQQDLVKQFALDVDTTVPLDSDSQRYLNIMAERAFDGKKLFEHLKMSPRELWSSTRPLGKYLVQDDAAKNLVNRWIEWFNDRFLQYQQQHWITERLEYSAELETEISKGKPVLSAKEYHGGHLDWHSFDVVSPDNLETTQKITIKAIPAPVRYRGMAASRFWEFEDGAVDFGGIEAAPEDLSRLLLVDFALVYGNDFFFIPVNLAIGTLCRQHELSVTDTFGIETKIYPSSNSKQPWRLFEISLEKGIDGTGIFFLAPTLVQSLESRPVEEVRFIRDEMLNIAWAIERTIEGASGHPSSRSEIENLNKPEAATPEEKELCYRLITGSPPSYWFPMLPKQPVQNHLEPKHTVQNHLELCLSSEQHSPMGRILSQMVSQEAMVFDEEVSRAGTQINYAYQYVRWVDGSTHLWLGRRRRPGRGEGSSGLRFDVAENR